MGDKNELNRPKKQCATVFGYPVSIFFIVVNEFCERFSYYGMRAVLVLYFTYFLKWDEDFSTTMYHSFVAICYLTPILGAILADSWLGKFKTIVYLSIVYCVGQAVMAVSAIHDISDTNRDGVPDNKPLHIALSMIGLLLIALGTGGIKPCVAAFGGDQFEEHQEKQRSTFFSIFYLSINAGSLLSTIITPILRSQECGIHSQQKCYPLAFGVPAALMVVSLVVFIVGNSMYTKTDPQGNIMVKFWRCVVFALANRYRHRSSKFPKREHWMDWAEEKYDKLLIAQVKMVLRVLFLYIPLPMFWALYDQQGSRWTLQATTMDGNFGLIVIQPDQMQTVNPILILILVPIMDNVVFPLVAKCKLNFTPLRKITVGMFFAALAFVVAALVQIQIDKTLPEFPSSTESQVKVLNMVNRTLSIKAGNYNFTLDPYMTNDKYLPFGKYLDLSVDDGPSETIDLVESNRTTVVILEDNPLKTLSFADIKKKPDEGANDIRFFNGYHSSLNITVGKLDYKETVSNNMSVYLGVKRGNARFRIFNNEGDECFYTQQLDFGSSWTLVIQPNFTFGNHCQHSIIQGMDMEPNSFHMAWQIPQYFLLTAGEVVYSVTGLQFSYSQAPSNMKAVLQAGWLLTVAVGNVIVLIVAEAATLPKQWTEYLLFASLLVLVCFIFSIMAYFYTYIDPAKIEAQFMQPDPEDEKKKNLEMFRKDSFEPKKERRNSSDSRSDSSSDSSSDEEEAKQTKI